MQNMSININRMRSVAGLFISALLLLMLGGCIGHIDRSHESSISKYSASELDKKLTIGKTTKKEVLLLLGRPAYPEDYNHQHVWLYRSKTQGRAIYAIVPVNYDRDITLVLTFDNNKILTRREYKEE